MIHASMNILFYEKIKHVWFPLTSGGTYTSCFCNKMPAIQLREDERVPAKPAAIYESIARRNNNNNNKELMTSSSSDFSQI